MNLILLLSLLAPLAATNQAQSRRAAERSVPAHTVFVGSVFTLDGRPASGAVVVTSAGGEAVCDGDGSFELALDVPIEAGGVEVTAVADSRRAGTLVASVRVVPPSLSPIASVGKLVLAPGVSPEARWLPGAGGQPGTDNAVNAFAVFDDGDGPALYVGGSFQAAGGTAASAVARWDGARWKRVGSGLAGNVKALTVFDDGSGPALYAGGDFPISGGANVARWDGTNWSSLGAGTDDVVYALAVYDDGDGPALFAGGHFQHAGGVSALRVARWDGVSWSALGSGITGGIGPDVRALAVFDDGSGAALFVAGRMSFAGGVPAQRIARWNGSSWSGLGSGLGGGLGPVRALAVFDDGSGPSLYAGGDFTRAGSETVSHIARWDGSSWHALGAGVTGGGTAEIDALTVWDAGAGPELYVGGEFTSAGGVAANRIARWDGASWSALDSATGGFVGTVTALTGFHDGRGPALYASGGFSSAGGGGATLARWDGAGWSMLGQGLIDDVLAVTAFDDGNGPALYAAGFFTNAGGAAASRIARWDGASWTALGGGMDWLVAALASFDDGSGPALYAGGVFTSAGGAPANHVARWDGTSWTALGSGTDALVAALASFDDGSGSALYAGGQFASAGGVPASRIARWDGSSWTSLGSGTNAPIQTLVSFDDGSGPALYAGGSFTSAGGVPANFVARWDGSSWSALGSGTNDVVFALASFDDGNGPALYAGGSFSGAGGVAANHVARWDGSSWAALGQGTNEEVRALATFDSGHGTALYAGCAFQALTGLPAGRVVAWDGSSWSELGGGPMFGVVNCLSVFDAGRGPALQVGGGFLTSPAGDSFLAQWGRESRVRQGSR